jgi:hypothetical protein
MGRSNYLAMRVNLSWVGGGIGTLMIYAHLLVKGVSGGLDHYTLNHPKINAI